MGRERSPVVGRVSKTPKVLRAAEVIVKRRSERKRRKRRGVNGSGKKGDCFFFPAFAFFRDCFFFGENFSFKIDQPKNSDLFWLLQWESVKSKLGCGWSIFSDQFLIKIGLIFFSLLSCSWKKGRTWTPSLFLSHHSSCI